MGNAETKPPPEEGIDNGSDIPDQLDLLQSGDQSDVVLVCGNQRFKVHSHILAARSDIFSALMQGLDDKRRRGINITDIGSLALEKMLHYIYSGVLPNMSIGTAMKVYEAAEIYLMESLKNKCGDIIKKKLNETSACDVLVFSDQLKGTVLKDAVVTYLTGRKSYLLSENWRRFCDSYPKLATEVHIAFIRSIK